MKLPSGRYCCLDCYARDLNAFAKMRSVNDADRVKFTVKEEEDWYDGDTEIDDSESE